MGLLRGWISRTGLIAAVTLAGCHRSPPPLDPKAEADGYYLKATAEYLQGNFPQALQDYEEVRKRNPTDPRLPAALGEVELTMGQLKEALAHFQESAKQDPKRSTTWSRIGYIQLQYGHLDDARSALLKALALNPHDYNALEGLGDIELKKGNTDHAIDDWMHSASEGPPAAAPSLWMKSAQALKAKNRVDEAIALLKKADAQHVYAPELSTLLGDMLVHQDKLREAVDAYTEAAKQSKKDPTLWELVGEIWVKLDRPANAEAALRESLKIEDRATVHAELGELYLSEKDPDRARQELEYALKVAQGEELREGPEMARLLFALGRHKEAYLLYKVAAADPDEAKDLDVQLATAKLAKEFKEPAVVEASCKRIAAAGKRGKCP